MSVTRQESVPAGMGHAAGSDGVVGDPSHYDEKNPPSPGPEAVPLRELIDDRLLDALLERSKDEAGGVRLTGEGSMLGEP
jgi:putative transposase